MKKYSLILFIFILTLLIFSCKNTTDIEQPENNSNEISEPNHNENITNNEITSDEPQLQPDKPENSVEIIALADSYNLDTSLTAFTLDGILEGTQLSLTDDAGDEYQNKTAYLGDSVSLGLGVFGAHPKSMVIAKGSINPMDAVDKKLYELEDGTLLNFPDALSLLDADRAVLTFGANAISIMSEETFLNYYIKLIDEIKRTNPECEIIIQSISPIAVTCSLKKFTNTLINRSNLLLLILAYSKDVRFLNSAPALKGDDGYLKLEYCSSDDGIHINQEGYKIWIDFLRTHAIIDE
jgi:hypothetical protein